MSATHAQTTPYVQAWRARLAAAPARRARERERALESARACAHMLAAEGARRVWLFGSLADLDRFGEHSDIDLAAEGVQAPKYLSVLNRLCDLAGREVQLVRLEHAPESLRRAVLAEGKLLYDAGA